MTSPLPILSIYDMYQYIRLELLNFAGIYNGTMPSGGEIQSSFYYVIQ